MKDLELGKNGRTRNKVYTVLYWCDFDKKSFTTSVYLCTNFKGKITREEYEQTDDYLNATHEIRNGKIITNREWKNDTRRNSTDKR